MLHSHLEVRRNHGYFHNQMCLPWITTPGLTFQLWWIFCFHLCCCKLLEQWQEMERRQMQAMWASEGAKRGEIRPPVLSSIWINHRITYLLQWSTQEPALLWLANIKARFPHINNKLSLAFHLWAIKCHHIHSNKEELHPVGWVARIF